MARGAGRNGSGRAVVDQLPQNAEPPQSTLTAQLVSHFTDGKKHPKYQDEETFGQLLREILGTESGQVVHPESLEKDCDMDSKLIYVIVKAGLGKATSNDPFNGNAELSRQATDSLAAINITLKRNPEVLFVAPQFQELDPRPIGPLYLWLMPKLLALTGCLQDSGTIDGVLRVLMTFLVNERKTHARKVYLHPVLKYMKGCINGQHVCPSPRMHQQLTGCFEDLVTYLETETSDPAGESNMSLCHVPSTVTVSRLCPRDLPQDELQRAIGVSFGYKTQVINTTMRLLSLFTTPSLSRPEVTSTIGLLTSEDSWTLNILTRFWEAIAPGGAQLNYEESTLLSVVSFLDRVRVYITHISGLDCLSAVVNRVSTLCSHITTTFLVREPLPLPSPVEKRLCLMVLDLALIDSKSGVRLQSFARETLSSIFEARRYHRRFDAFGQDLQVRASRCFF